MWLSSVLVVISRELRGLTCWLRTQQEHQFCCCTCFGAPSYQEALTYPGWNIFQSAQCTLYFSIPICFIDRLFDRREHPLECCRLSWGSQIGRQHLHPSSISALRFPNSKIWFIYLPFQLQRHVTSRSRSHSPKWV